MTYTSFRAMTDLSVVYCKEGNSQQYTHCRDLGVGGVRQINATIPQIVSYSVVVRETEIDARLHRNVDRDQNG